mmetsp:Transcript_32058/g.102117  ORF Transcript_32058/g.102117 Transcript_32058/m.102117 type:complete len:234 (-) Transcript_32058:873-1574(-)
MLAMVRTEVSRATAVAKCLISLSKEDTMLERSLDRRRSSSEQAMGSKSAEVRPFSMSLPNPPAFIAFDACNLAISSWRSLFRIASLSSLDLSAVFSLIRLSSSACFASTSSHILLSWASSSLSLTSLTCGLTWLVLSSCLTCSSASSSFLRMPLVWLSNSSLSSSQCLSFALRALRSTWLSCLCSSTSFLSVCMLATTDREFSSDARSRSSASLAAASLSCRRLSAAASSLVN